MDSEYLRDVLERTRDQGLMLLAVLALLAWLVLTLVRKDVLTWQDFGLAHG